MAIKSDLRKMGSSMISMAALAALGEGPAGAAAAGQSDEGAAAKKVVSEKVRCYPGDADEASVGVNLLW